MFRPVRISGGISQLKADLALKSLSAQGVLQPHHSTHTKKPATSPEKSTNIWLLSRQPFMRHRLPMTQIPVPTASKMKTTTTETRMGTTTEKQNHLLWSQWTLWDNRYWFRFSVTPKETKHNQHNDSKTKFPSMTTIQDTETKQTTIPLTIRPFQPRDLQRINSHLKRFRTIKTAATFAPGEKIETTSSASTITATSHPGNDQQLRLSLLLQNIKRQLADEAPGLVRFCLPVVTLSEPWEGIAQRQRQYNPEGGEGGAEEQLGQILALPTLQQSSHTGLGSGSGSRSWSGAGDLSGHFTYASRSWILNWEWMYKMVDAEVLRRMSS